LLALSDAIDQINEKDRLRSANFLVLDRLRP